MEVQEIIDALLAEDISVDEQYKLVKKLDENVLEDDVLLQIAECFLQKSLLVKNPFEETIDIVGTGGDGLQTLNYSTLSALVVHALGAKVAKHGNKSATSKCGSFDFLERLDIVIPKTPEEAYNELVNTGFTFLFAPYFHPIFARVKEVRGRFAEEGKRTFFNILGPLLNPMRVKRMMVGVYQKELLMPYAKTLSKLGVEYAYVVHGDGMDEFSVCGVNQVVKIDKGEISEFSLHPEQLGFIRSKLDYLTAGDSFTNFEESQALLSNELLGAKQDTLVLNAAAALHVARGFEGTLGKCVEEVQQRLKQGEFSALLAQRKD
ncbi:anthranilate phosphoribosyltransferase [Fangia hongkongensis]|uniref:anthranilate phosphoribosyltransferase n=1 Tax=Fangia hongkongensis TaxID=270495 RepID=UPI0003792203|nr:anthranilate phosphoribosyltransferase [Fangia hongkongensis]MBK2125593.1 anthranilate phosphoribosyltransferase [Fangia hongkongensis]